MPNPNLDPEFVALMRAGLKAEAESAAPSRLGALFRHLFVPALLLLAATPFLGRTASGFAIIEAPPAASTTLGLIATLFTVFIAEQLFPANPSWNARLLSDGRTGLRALGRDLFYIVGVTQLTSLLIRSLDPAVLRGVAALGLPHLLWPSRAPFALRVLLAFGLVELGSYWVHRAAHHFRPLWQFHSTHHVIGELNGFKALRTHPVDNLIFHAVRTVPLILLGAGPNELAAAIYLGAVLGVLSHANVKLSPGLLGWVINFPRFHSVHHSADLAESRSNFGCHTVIWDRLFRTFRAQPHGELQLGVHPLGRRTLWQELVAPFYKRI